MKVNLSRGLTVDGTELFAGEQFVSDAVAEKLRGMEGVTFPDEGSVAADGPPVFEYSAAAIKAGPKRMAAELEAFVASQLPPPVGAKISPTSADKTAAPPKEIK